MHYTANLLSHVPTLVAQGGYGLLGASVFLEALPLIGSLIPGHVIIIAAGFIAKLGLFKLSTVLLISIIGAVLGDMVGYVIGRKWGEHILIKFGKRLFLKEEYIERTKKLIQEHTRKAIVFGKFSPITRPFMAFIIGSSHVRSGTFWFYNILGGALWVTVSVLIGYLFGASYPVIAHFMGRFIFLAVIFAVLIIWGYRVINRQFHIFKKYELFMLGLNILSLFALFKTIEDSFSKNSFMANFDIYVNVFMSHHFIPSVVHISSVIGKVADTTAFFVLGLVVGFAFMMKSRFRRAGIILLSVISTTAIVQWSKAFFMRVRPINALEVMKGGSFPSGHASLSAAFFIACLYVFAPRIKSWVLRELFIVACVVATIIVGLSRLVLNVHWASDVVAGWALGVFLASGSVLFIRYAGAVLLRDTK